MYNKRLRKELQEHFGDCSQVPEALITFLKVISDSYDEHENFAMASACGEMGKINEALAGEINELKIQSREINRLFESIDEVLFSIDMVSYTLNQVSAACENIYGYTAGEFMDEGALWKKVIYPRDRKSITHHLKFLSQGKQVTAEYRIIHKHLGLRWIQSKVMPVLDEKGVLIRIHGVSCDISERKHKAQELERSFSILEATIESTADGILVADFYGKIIRFNKKFVELWHIPAEIVNSGDDERAIAYVLHQLVNPGEFVSRIKELYVNKKEVSFNILHFKDGRTFERYSQPQLINRSSVGRVWSFRDITERKKAEEALQKSEQRLRQIIDLVPHFIFAKDADGKYILANEAVCKAFGCSVEELIGKTDAEMNAEKELVNYLRQEDLKVISSENSRYNIEESITDSDGNIRILSTTKIKYTSLGVDAPGVLGVSVDISEQKKAENVLKESRNQLSIAAQIAKLGYWEFDTVKGLFTFNDQFYSIFKTTAEKMGGYIMAPDRYAGLFVHPADGPLIAREVANAINSEDPDFTRQIEHRIIYANGETGWISVHFFIVKDDEGRTIKTFGVNQDITDRKKGEETILRSEASMELKNRELEIKNKDLEQFAFVASHDLQEPLRTISSFVKLLQNHCAGKLDDKAEKYINYILGASDRLKALIKNLLEYSVAGSKKEFQNVNCREVLENVLADIHVAVEESSANITYVELPLVSGYATEIKQLFQNLLINAIKFRKKDSYPSIQVSARKVLKHWEFAVKDDGIGIDEQYREKIFNIFQRLHSRTEFEGSGIGLSYCKKIVELHNGKIWVESTPGLGSTFHFTLAE